MLHKVHIRYHATTDDIMSAHIAAVGGTPHITDNGDGTYDVWSDDACEFIGVAGVSGSYYSAAYYNGDLNVTKIEVLSGHTIRYAYKVNPDYSDIGLFAAFGATEIVWHGAFGITDFSGMFLYCEDLVKLTPAQFFYGGKPTGAKGMLNSCALDHIDFTGCDFSDCVDFEFAFSSGALKRIVPYDFMRGASPETLEYAFAYTKIKKISFYGVDFSGCDNMSGVFRGCVDLVCVTNLDTTSATNRSSLFDGCTSLVQPDSAAQADLTDSDGANWVNPDPCQGVRVFSQQEEYPQTYTIAQGESLLASLSSITQKEGFPRIYSLVQKEGYPSLAAFVQSEAVMTTQAGVSQVEALLPHATILRQSESYEQERVWQVRYFRQRERLDGDSGVSDTLIRIVAV